jgi:hypothetical protein
VALADGREPEEAGAGMSGSVEASRRHGAFDSRWLKRLRLVAPVRAATAWAGREDVSAALDWNAHFYPGSRRHDLEAISAYYAYQRGREAVEEHPQGAQRREADEPPALIAMEASSESPALRPSTSR